MRHLGGRSLRAAHIGRLHLADSGRVAAQGRGDFLHRHGQGPVHIFNLGVHPLNVSASLGRLVGNAAQQHRADLAGQVIKPSGVIQPLEQVAEKPGVADRLDEPVDVDAGRQPVAQRNSVCRIGVRLSRVGDLYQPCCGCLQVAQRYRPLKRVAA